MTVINFQLQIFIIIACGYVFAKKGIINLDIRKKLTDIVINLILPCAIIKSFSMKVTSEIIRDTIIIFFVSFALQLSYSILNKFLYCRFDHSKVLIMKYATIVSNAAFMGLPIIESVYGAQGVLYGSIALIPLRIFMWSSGLSLFTTTDRKQVFKTIALHPCIIAVYIGIIIMGIESMNIVIPSFISSTVNTVGGCLTAISMITIGAILSDIKWFELLDKSALYYSAIRLIAIPVLFFMVLTLLRLNPLVIGVNVLLAAMPAGSTVAMLAQKYDKDVIYASKIVIISTVLSLITLPLISLMISR
ncbi:hypothetical protein HPL003_01895 [Paenibacillus terrae HPL-003]|uniref:Transporter n=1 Tax=Paenibacillus terrae (strain HPL-003) TaxID=985665 RepID=G7VXY5_PAETH|nr:AEC family transporter [Paenibacillus terrae]AET57163.1 hypothetical protein HPL003_01895 [Paenibacillus terrae HPL-003]